MIKILNLVGILLYLSSALSITFDYRPSADLAITWDKTVPLSFDVNEHCISKCYNDEYIYVTFDANVTDYSKILQASIDSLKTKKGGTLFLSAGTYPISTQLVLNSNTCLVGADYTTTSIKLIDYSPAFTQAGLVRNLAQENITLSDITLDGNRLNQFTDVVSSYGRYGYYSEVSDYIFLNKVQINSFQGYGFDPHGDKKAWASYLVILNCLASLNGFDGYALDQTYNITYANNVAKSNDRHGVNVVTGSKFGVISNNHISENGMVSTEGCGITLQNNDLFNTSDWTINNNILKDNYADEICIRDTDNVDMTENMLSKKITAPGYCFLVENSTSINIINNTCYADNFLNDKNNVKLVESNNIERAPSTPDPSCANGIINKDICCEKGCLSCGGSTCSTDPLGAENCCTNIILASLYSCLDFSAPCIIGYVAPTLPPNASTSLPTVSPTTPGSTAVPTSPGSTQTVPPTVPGTTTKPTVPPTVPGTTAKPTVPDATVEPTISPTTSGTNRQLSGTTVLQSLTSAAIMIVAVLV